MMSHAYAPVNPEGGKGQPKPGWLQDHFVSWDGAKIFYRFYPVPKARHTVLMLHGYGEHSGRYEKFPSKMGRISAQFAIMDFRGMGRSEGARGDVNSFEDYPKDVTAFVTHLRRHYGTPSQFILFGHSFGGLVAAQWGLKNPAPIKRLILSAPFLQLKYSCLAEPLNQAIFMFAPSFVYKNPVQPKSLSHDPAEIAIYRNDPLILRSISARLVREIVYAMRRLRKLPVLSLSFPVHLLMAGEERIVDPAGARRFFDRLVAPRKERTVFEGFYHEIFNERDQQRVFNVLKTIIEDCV